MKVKGSDALLYDYDLDDAPDVSTLLDWMQEGGCECPDGCWVEMDGKCEHGLLSWAKLLGVV